MTIYKYLKSKYGKRIVKQIFDSNSELNKSKAIGIIGVRGSGSTTIQALEIVLSKIVFGVEYNVMTKEEVIELKKQYENPPKIEMIENFLFLTKNIDFVIVDY